MEEDGVVKNMERRREGVVRSLLSTEGIVGMEKRLEGGSAGVEETRKVLSG